VNAADFAAKLRAIQADPEMHWVTPRMDDQVDPGEAHQPADKVLLEALRAAGWGEVADAYDALIQAAGGSFWFE
jgi:hypothetical protein